MLLCGNLLLIEANVSVVLSTPAPESATLLLRITSSLSYSSTKANIDSSFLPTI